MDQSRPRPDFLITPLIEKPELQSPQQRTLYSVLTVAFWIFWIYLWVPVLALFAWVLGIQQAYRYMIVLGGYQDLLHAAELYGGVILGLGGALLLWAGYNIYRFSGVENRTAAQPLTLEAVARHFDQDPAALAGWRSERRLFVTHNESGRIDRVAPTDDLAARG